MHTDQALSLTAGEHAGLALPVVARPLDFQTLQIGMHWLPDHGGNGLDRVFYALMQSLPGAGVGVHGVVVSAKGDLDGDETVSNAGWEHAPLLRRLLAYRRTIRHELAQRPCDLVASHFALYTAPALDLLRDRPVVFHFHGPWALESGVEGEGRLRVRSKAVLERAVYRNCHRFIVLSSAFGDVLRKHYRVPEERIRIVPGGVDVSRFAIGKTRREAREELGWPVDRPTVLAVRRLSRRMGLENLISAMQRVARAVPDVLLHIAGKGPLAEELSERIREAGLERNVRLLGFVPEEQLPLVYRAADLSVVPSVALEGFGLITVESLASGTPVLVTPVGGLPEVVRNLSEDLVLRDTGVEALAEGITAALRGTLRLPGQDACEAYAREHFGWSKVAANVRAVYEEALR